MGMEMGLGNGQEGNGKRVMGNGELEIGKTNKGNGRKDQDK